MKWHLMVVGAAVAATSIAVTGQPAQSGGVRAGYSDTQAARGQALYVENCAACHGKELAGDPFAPPLSGPAFVGKWKDRSADALFEVMRATMPQNAPGGLNRQQNADLLAFILQRNKVPAGNDSLPVETNALRGMTLALPPVAAAPAAPALPTAAPAAVAAAIAGQGFYTEAQAHRGRTLFNRWCTACHIAEPPPAGQPTTGRGFWFGSLRVPINIGGAYTHKFPSVSHLFRRVNTMPSFNTAAIGPAAKADIVAYLLQRGGFPGGANELKPDAAVMKTMKLAGAVPEAGFEPLFNGKDFTGIGILLGPNCRPQPEGCGRTTPDGVLSVQNGEIVTTGRIHGYWYSQKRYLNFTLRFDYRFPRPADLDPDDEYFDGNSGYLIFGTDHQVWPRSIEIQGNNAEPLSAIGIDATIKSIDDHEARKKAYHPVGQWSSVEIVSKDGVVKSYLNGMLVNTVTSHPFKEPGYIGFQSEGVEIHWRNIRIKPE